ncbi:MAG: PAS domain-containing protein, partial [Ignavibacteria bacterium]|nr:PAS domain-containing protein [Ignavibacteria bacterium]
MNESKKEIKFSDDLFRSLVELSPEPFIIHTEGRIVFINNAGIKLAGAKSAEELLGQSIFKFIQQEYHSLVSNRIKKMLENWEPAPVIELKLINLNNEEIEVELIAVPIMYLGSPSIQVILRDLTERKKILRSLSEYEEKYRLVFENAPDMYFIITPDGIVKNVNQFGANLLGYNKDELIGDYVWKIIHPEDLDRIKEQTSTIFENPDKVLELEFRKVKKDGTIIWVRERTKLLIYGENQISELLIACRDITERRKTSEQITMLANAVRSVKECVSITDMNDKIIFVNQAFLKTYGYEENEIIGKHISVLRVESDQNNLIKEILTQNQLNGWKGELLNRRKDGSVFPISLSTSLIKDEHGKGIAMIGVATDITEAKQAQKLQNALFKITEKSNSVKDIDEYYSYIHSIVGELMYAENFYIAIYDEHTQKLSFDYFKDQFDSKPQPRKLKKGLTELVLRTGEVYFVTQEKFEELAKAGEVELIG